MGKPKVPAQPAPPDPNVVAGAQTGSNVTTAIANSVLGNANTSGPYGSTSNSISGYIDVTDPNSGKVYQIPQFSQATTLDPAQQGLLDQQNQLAGKMNQIGLSQADKIGGILGSPVNTDGMTPWSSNLSPGQGLQTSIAGAGQGIPVAGQGIQYSVPGAGVGMVSQLGTAGPIQSSLGATQNQVQYGFDPTKPMQFDLGPTDFSADRLKVEEALMSRINPQIAQDRDQLENRLINQGFVRGTEAFNQAMDEVNRTATDSRFQAVLAGGQEQTRMFDMALQQGQFKNAAVAQDFSQNLARAGFFNAAQAQEFAEILQRGTFANAAQAQQYSQMLNSAEFQNAAQAQLYGQNLSSGQFANSAQNQNFSQGLAAQNQMFGQNLAAGQFANSAQNQNFNQYLTAGQFQNTTRQGQLQEQFALRNQPINEITALTSGGQVSMPQFQGYQGGQVQATPIGDYYMQNAQMANQQYMQGVQANAQATAGLYGALGSLGGAGLYGFMKSDRRIKTDIEQLGMLPNGLPFYRFKFIGHDDQHVGLMAQDVELVNPAAVVEIGGIKHVNYDLAMA